MKKEGSGGNIADIADSYASGSDGQEIERQNTVKKKGRNSSNLRHAKTTTIAPPLNARNPDEIQIMIKNKADMTDLKHVMDIKANKVDTENNMRCIDILHKQIEHVIVLLVEFLKTNV